MPLELVLSLGVAVAVADDVPVAVLVSVLDSLPVDVAVRVACALTLTVAVDVTELEPELVAVSVELADAVEVSVPTYGRVMDGGGRVRRNVRRGVTITSARCAIRVRWSVAVGAARRNGGSSAMHARAVGSCTLANPAHSATHSCLTLSSRTIGSAARRTSR